MRNWICALAVSAALGSGSLVLAGVPNGDNQYFDYADGQAGQNIPPDFTPSPFLTDQTAAQVDAFLKSEASHGTPLAVKIPTNYIVQPGSPAANVLTGNAIKYVFADLEGPNAIPQTAALVNLVNSSGSASKGAAVGNYYFATDSHDLSRAPGGNVNGSPSYVTPSSNDLDTAYRPSGVSMSNAQLYPGQPDYRQAGRDTAPDGTPIANLRTGFFMGPIMRISAVTNDNSTSAPNIPYVSRFESYANPTFATGNANDAGGGYVFTNPTGDQMLSRQDFQAQMLAYRMRGATGFHLHLPGVVGYTQQQFQADARKGFEAANTKYGFGVTGGPSVGTAQPVTTNNLTIKDALDNTYHSIDNEGVVFSGVYNSAGGNSGNGGMTILVSNLSGSNKYVVLPTYIGDGILNATNLNDASAGAGNLPAGSLPAGLGNDVVAISGADSNSHRLLQFTRDSNFNWSYVGDNNSAFDTDPSATARNGVGIPEPAAISLLALGGLGVLVHRPRRIA